MLRTLTTALGILCALSAQLALAVDMKPVQVAAHSWYVMGKAGMASSANEGFMSNAGFVITDDSVVVFDALGTPALGEQLIAEIRKLTTKPIQRLIVSHYHADHYYGTQAFKAIGAEVWAHRRGREALESDGAQARLAQRKADLFPFVDDNTRLLPADRWLEGNTDFEKGGLHFRITYVGPAHAPDDIIMEVVEDRVIFAGDMLFRGRVPFVGDADTSHWLLALDHLIDAHPAVVVPGHGPASTEPQSDLTLTRDYLKYVRESMGKAVSELKSFDEAYADTDWSRWSRLPAFREANRANAYNVFLQMEKGSLR
ncbi:MBL fold metallo-hydrolase [Azoarcus sp. L1K30]|uniref:MBL fold metallo-hydrolase n=1 Tax=Azoarcus sp. L1K30 TaxID=2820277 RepID=UPI001B819D2F|nr:MBL fold metallo-hydrolase [Azoarcus sp. L1K30]MBR0566744.1 MBL fold metallo-hydrolase [Azoarcus sp. L1K30]